MSENQNKGTKNYNIDGGPINGMGFGNWFRVKYLRLQSLHHPFALRELYVIALFYVIYWPY